MFWTDGLSFLNFKFWVCKFVFFLFSYLFSSYSPLTATCVTLDATRGQERLPSIRKKPPVWRCKPSSTVSTASMAMLQPRFDILKARHFDSSWNWVRQDALLMYYDIIFGRLTTVDRDAWKMEAIAYYSVFGTSIFWRKSPRSWFFFWNSFPSRYVCIHWHPPFSYTCSWAWTSSRPISNSQRSDWLAWVII